MVAKVNSISCFLVYTGLLTISLYIVFIGPFSDFIRNEKRFVQTYQKTNDLKEPLKWPDVVICKSPTTKNKETYKVFMDKKFANESEYQDLIKEVFYTQPKEFVYAFGIGATYHEAIQHAKASKYRNTGYTLKIQWKDGA